jgi:hypothetical protein
MISHISLVIKVDIKHPTDAPYYSKRRSDTPRPGGAQRVAAFREFEDEFFGVLFLVALTLYHVGLDKLTKLCDDKADELLLQTEEKVLKIGDDVLVKAQVDTFVTLGKGLHTGARG